MLKCRQKSRWVTETDLPLLTNVSYTNTLCSTGQVSIVTEVANPEEKNANHLSPPSTYLQSSTHSKDFRFPWVTLYPADWCIVDYINLHSVIYHKTEVFINTVLRTASIFVLSEMYALQL
jgi:hypothetical protein